MDDQQQQGGGVDARHGEITPHHLRVITLQSLRKRLAILHHENAKLNIPLEEDLDEETAERLIELRNALQKTRSENTLFAMRSLLKRLESELALQGLTPTEHIKWVLEQLNSENATA